MPAIDLRVSRHRLHMKWGGESPLARRRYFATEAQLPREVRDQLGDTPFSEMVTTEEDDVSQTSGTNPSLYTNYKKTKATKKPAKKGC